MFSILNITAEQTPMFDGNLCDILLNVLGTSFNQLLLRWVPLLVSESWDYSTVVMISHSSHLQCQ